MRAFGGPADLEIKPRNVEFGRGVNYERWWCGGDPVVTAFFNALSLTFPQGESFFVNSVRRYLPELSEPLRGQVEEFAQQEAYHSREHMAFNRQVAAAYEPYIGRWIVLMLHMDDWPLSGLSANASNVLNWGA